MSFGFLFMHQCSHCKAREERVFTDCWTGRDFCLMCLHQVAGQITMSPSEDGDNLEEVLAGI